MDEAFMEENNGRPFIGKLISLLGYEVTK